MKNKLTVNNTSDTGQHDDNYGGKVFSSIYQVREPVTGGEITPHGLCKPKPRRQQGYEDTVPDTGSRALFFTCSYIELFGSIIVSYHYHYFIVGLFVRSTYIVGVENYIYWKLFATTFVWYINEKVYFNYSAINTPTFLQLIIKFLEKCETLAPVTSVVAKDK